MGHSMGGLLALEYALNGKYKFDSIILSAPALGITRPPSTIKVFFGRIASYFFPKMAIDNGLDLRGISRDVKVINNYENDPLNHQKVTLYTARKILDLQKKFMSKNSATIDTPIILLHGNEDILTSVEASKQFFQKLDPNTCRLFVIDGGYHECKNSFLIISTF